MKADLDAARTQLAAAKAAGAEAADADLEAARQQLAASQATIDKLTADLQAAEGRMADSVKTRETLQANLATAQKDLDASKAANAAALDKVRQAAKAEMDAAAAASAEALAKVRQAAQSEREAATAGTAEAVAEARRAAENALKAAQAANCGSEGARQPARDARRPDRAQAGQCGVGEPAADHVAGRHRPADRDCRRCRQGPHRPARDLRGLGTASGRQGSGARPRRPRPRPRPCRASRATSIR